jgi:hypothetical protein
VPPLPFVTAREPPAAASAASPPSDGQSSRQSVAPSQRSEAQPESSPVALAPSPLVHDMGPASESDTAAIVSPRAPRNEWDMDILFASSEQALPTEVLERTLPEDSTQRARARCFAIGTDHVASNDLAGRVLARIEILRFRRTRSPGSPWAGARPLASCAPASFLVTRSKPAHSVGGRVEVYLMHRVPLATCLEFFVSPACSNTTSSAGGGRRA